MELDKLAADILQQFPELKDLKRPDLFTIAKAIRKLGRLKNKELKESAKQEKRDQRKAKRLAKQEAEKNISIQKEKEDIVAQQEEEKRQEALREQKERIAKLIEETTDEPVKARLLGIKKKWETRNAAKLEKVKEKLLAKLHKLKSAKIKQNALDRMDSTLLKAEIALNKKLEKRLTGIKEKAYSKKSAKATTKQEKREAKKKAKEEKERKKIAAQKKKEEEIKNRTEAVKIIVERIEQLINGATDESIRKKLSVSKQSWEARNTAKLKNLEKELSAKIHDVKSPKAKQNVLDRTSRILSETKIKLYDRLEKRLRGIKKTSEKNRSDQLAKKKNVTGKKIGKVAQEKSARGSKKNSGEIKPEREQIVLPEKEKAITAEQKCKVSKSTGSKLAKKKIEEEDDQEIEEENVSSQDSLSLYLKNIGKYKLLTREEEVKLSEEAQKGNQGAINKLVKHNLRLVVSVAKKFLYTGVPLQDLIELGNIGLIKTVPKFDGKKGFKFATYAVWRIKQEIQRGLADCEGPIIRLPVHRVDQISFLKRCRHELAKKLKRAPEDYELADYMGLKEEVFLKVKELASNCIIQLEEPIRNSSSKSEKSTATNQDMIADTIHMNPEEKVKEINLLEFLGEEIETALAVLKPKARLILEKRFLGPEKATLEEVGEELGLTRERIRQIEEKALDRLRRYFLIQTKKGVILKKLLA